MAIQPPVPNDAAWRRLLATCASKEAFASGSGFMGASGAPGLASKLGYLRFVTPKASPNKAQGRTDPGKRNGIESPTTLKGLPNTNAGTRSLLTACSRQPFQGCQTGARNILTQGGAAPPWALFGSRVAAMASQSPHRQSSDAMRAEAF